MDSVESWEETEDASGLACLCAKNGSGSKNSAMSAIDPELDVVSSDIDEGE